jgi:hypothetical protein
VEDYEWGYMIDLEEIYLNEWRRTNQFAISKELNELLGFNRALIFSRKKFQEYRLDKDHAYDIYLGNIDDLPRNEDKITPTNHLFLIDADNQTYYSNGGLRKASLSSDREYFVCSYRQGSIIDPNDDDVTEECFECVLAFKLRQIKNIDVRGFLSFQWRKYTRKAERLMRGLSYFEFLKATLQDYNRIIPEMSQEAVHEWIKSHEHLGNQNETKKAKDKHNLTARQAMLLFYFILKPQNAWPNETGFIKQKHIIDLIHDLTSTSKDNLKKLFAHNKYLEEIKNYEDNLKDVRDILENLKLKESLKLIDKELNRNHQ